MSNQDPLFARVKPYNPKRGHVVRRIVVLGTLWEGGSGVPPDTIPTWTKVNAAQAVALKACLQIDNDPYSQRVFDIVTAEQRKQIDAREERYRRAILGYGASPTIAELPDVTAKDSGARGGSSQPLNEDGSRMTLADLKDAKGPDMLPVDTDDEIGGLPDMRPATTPNVVADERDVSGRASAADGFDSSEDMNADDDADDDGDVGITVPTNVPPPAGKAASKSKTKSRSRGR